jgi:mannose-6-phosphate isomerase-like protein (cupin superfamily)
LERATHTGRSILSSCQRLNSRRVFVPSRPFKEPDVASLETAPAPAGVRARLASIRNRRRTGQADEDLEPTIDPRLYQNRKSFTAEVVYELTTARDGLPFGIAIADIEQSQPHVHRVTTETYTVVQGSIELALDDERLALHVGDVALIRPGVIHSARSIGDGHAARITVTTIPEFSPDDYVPVSASGAVGHEQR